MSGTVNISRDLWDDTAFRDDEFSQREAWIWMIAEASWKQRTRRIGSQEITLERGQLAGSVRFFAERWKWTPARVFRYFDMLKNRNMIECSAGTAATVITICKYDTYQNPIRSGETQAERSPKQSRNSGETNEKKGEIREEVKIEIGKPISCAFADFWSVWPSKKAKANAAKAWAKLSADDRTKAKDAAVAWFAKWRASSPSASPIHAASYLNGRRWEDEIEPPMLRAINGGQSPPVSIPKPDLAAIYARSPELKR